MSRIRFVREQEKGKGEKRMDIKTILFDLDGTLTDSGEGIMNAVHYTLERYEKTATEAQLRSFIGPPLQTQFQQFLNVSEEEGKRAVSIYREYYTERGIFENKVYAGVIGLLEQLKASGFRICMATSKPETFAVQIAEHFSFASYFDRIGGALMDGRRTKKCEVIEYVLAEEGIGRKRDDRDSVLMIGDREHDILGAKQTGIHSMGVLYGYGSREELEKAGAEWIAETLGQIWEILRTESRK